MMIVSFNTCRKHFPVLFSIMTYHRVCIYMQINTTGFTSRIGTTYPSGAPDFTPDFQWGSYYSIFSFMCMFCRSLFVLSLIFFWPLCCLLLFDIRILITSLWYLQALLTQRYNLQNSNYFYSGANELTTAVVDIELYKLQLYVQCFVFVDNCLFFYQFSLPLHCLFPFDL